MKQQTDNTQDKQVSSHTPGNNFADSFFEQAAMISKSHAYDIVVPSLQEENKKLNERITYLENLIDEYTTKMTVNLSGGKVDEFLKEQVNDIPDTLFNKHS